VIPMFALLIVFFVILSRSEVGRAIADAIRHNSGAGRGAAAGQELEQLRAEMDQLRTELDDVHAQLLEAHERLDFAERLLAQRNDQAPLPLNRTPA
jgi:multidrug resistance efflux pump